MLRSSSLPLHLQSNSLYSRTLQVQLCKYSYERSNIRAMAQSVRIAVVGDVHDDWDTQQDSKALLSLKPDLVLFTGDFGNENVEVVKGIGSLDLPKAVILGNHDCWNTGKFSSKGSDPVQLQLACLGKEHVGYDRLDFPQLKLSVVGGRPFSCGGDKIFRPRLISKRYGVKNMEESAKKIYETALGAPNEHSIVLLAHNGPTGLGSNMSDICGRDWFVEGGDHGDTDLEEAVSLLKNNSQAKIAFVVFGHMHKRLAYGDTPRTMLVIGDDEIFYLNGAIVPRVRDLTAETGDGTTSFHEKGYSVDDKTYGTTKREFTVVDLVNGKPRRITEVWVTVNEEVTEIEESVVYDC